MGNKTSKLDNDEKAKYRSFPGSAILEKDVCGSIDTTDPDEYQDASAAARLVRRAETLCVITRLVFDWRVRLGRQQLVAGNTQT